MSQLVKVGSANILHSRLMLYERDITDKFALLNSLSSSMCVCLILQVLFSNFLCSIQNNTFDERLYEVNDKIIKFATLNPTYILCSFYCYQGDPEDFGFLKWTPDWQCLIHQKLNS